MPTPHAPSLVWLLPLTAVLAVIVFAVAVSQSEPWKRVVDSRYELQVITMTGEMFVAGSGDTCSEARSKAVYPKNIRSLECVWIVEYE